NFLTGLLIVLAPTAIAGAYVALGFAREARGEVGFRRGIDLAGGTILVYEINLERTKQRKEAAGDPQAARRAGPAEGLSSDEMAQLAAQIKRRIDPADLKNVTVRPLGNSRVEIILPTGGAASGGRSNLSAEDIEEIKRLVSQMGVLEFRILANQYDDEQGINEARRNIEQASTETRAEWAVRGSPPPPPEGEFDVKAESDKAHKVRYVWAELGPEERESLGLQNAAEGNSKTWTDVAKARAEGKTYVHTGGNEGKTYSMLLYSREVKNPAVLEAEAKEKVRLESEGKGEEFNAKKYEYFLLTRVSPLDTVKVEGDISLTATSGMDAKFNPSVDFRFNGAGGQAFGRMTERNKPAGNNIRSLAIVLDQKVVSAPTLNAVITTQGQISGRFDRKSVDRLVMILRNGALNAQLREKPVSENTIGPTLGADTIKKGTMAVGLSFLAVMVFMVIYYRFAGFVACVALMANLLLTLGFMVSVNAAFTLAGLAGVVLMLGMAVDANVLIYERLREERGRGANLATAIRNGYDRAFPTIIDTHLSSIFTSIVLYVFGNENLKGFAISLTVGLIISLFTSLYMTRLIFDFALHKKWVSELRMMRLFERPNFNPMSYRFIFFTITGVLTVAGLALFLARGDQGLNVDFRGGTVYAGKLKAGEERGLSTVNGQPGLRELLTDPANQQKKLDVKEVNWENQRAGVDINAYGVYVFDILYADGAKTTVGLTQKPAGNNAEELEADVLRRAKQLPDVSVEQMFLSDDNFADGKSRYFTVRTTERQPDLVRASLDRLLRNEKGEALVASPDMTPPVVSGPVVELKFNMPVSPSRISDLLEQRFQAMNRVDAANTTFELKGVGDGDQGRFPTMRLDVSKNTNFATLKAKAMLDAATGPAGVALAGGPTAVVAAGLVDVKAAEAEAASLQQMLRDVETAVETRPEPERLEVFDSQLATETRAKAFYAIIASWAAILMYLWFRFGNWTFGAAAVLCLVHDLCFTLGIIAACHYVHDTALGRLLGLEDFKIDLPAVAALLTLVGYSVNDTIVVFDRIREVRGKNPKLTPQIINDSVNQTLSRTVLASLTVFLVVGVLYLFGGEGVHLFSFVMVVGVIVGTYSSIFVAAPLLLIFGEGHHELAPEDLMVQTTDEGKPKEEEVVEG
ncbi:MAG TPA: protein translocase subunit SecD, partial [Urbifossiella sp.]|nr:protein translocase subunit SecD [Urbifossiella sp.]